MVCWPWSVVTSVVEAKIHFTLTHHARSLAAPPFPNSVSYDSSCPLAPSSPALSRMQAKILGRQLKDSSVCTTPDGSPQPALLLIPISVVSVWPTLGTICKPNPELMKLGLPLAMCIPVCLLPPVPQVPPGTTRNLCVSDWGAQKDCAAHDRSQEVFN